LIHLLKSDKIPVAFPIMIRTSPHPLLVLFSGLFAFAVLGISLMSASVGSFALRESPASSRKIRFSSEIVPGHILYPLTVIRDKVSLVLMNTAQQCQERLELAKERLNQAKHLLELDDRQLALETMVKGQRYITEASEQCQQNNLPLQYRENIRATIQLYQQTLQSMKPDYSDTDRAKIDQLLLQNDALLLQLGKN
jgi:hypothetical protein